jgi:hypothetical protein
VILFTEECVFSKSLSIESNIVLDLSHIFLDLSSSWVKEIVDNVVHTGNILFSITDILFEGDDSGVMFISTSREICLKVLELFIKIFNKFLYGIDKFLDWSLDGSMKTQEVEESSSEF